MTIERAVTTSSKGGALKDRLEEGEGIGKLKGREWGMAVGEEWVWIGLTPRRLATREWPVATAGHLIKEVFDLRRWPDAMDIVFLEGE